MIREQWIRDRLSVIEHVMGRPGFWELPEAQTVAAEHAALTRLLARF